MQDVVCNTQMHNSCIIKNYHIRVRPFIDGIELDHESLKNIVILS